jgi:hypothetical protein
MDQPDSLTLSRRAALAGLLSSFAALAAVPSVARAFTQMRMPNFQIGNRAMGLLRTDEQVQALEVFNPAEQAIITRLAEVIIPTDELPGARETGTAGAVLFALGQQDALVIQALHQAIAAVDAISRQLFGQTFVALPFASADQVAGVLAATPELAPFWESVRTLTVLDFYAQEVAYRPLGLPGPNLDRGGFPDGQSTPVTRVCN